MLAEERRHRILEILSQTAKGAVSVAELSESLGVSGMTIRRDLEWLEDASLLSRVHGGAVATRLASDEKSFTQRGREHGQQKELIGRLAAEMVGDGESIILDAGTTTHQIARALGTRHDLVVITNALPVAEELARWPAIQTIVLGGILKQRELCMVGPMVTQELARLSVDKAFISTSALSIEMGASDPDLRESEVKQAMIRAAREVILVADSSKWGQRALIQVAPLRSVHRLVTDDGLDPAALAVLEAEGVSVLTPERSATRA
jgi:DeoR family transcriptional regulator, fructose operon transcriptional repressor